jgi:hypothetical protein
MKMPPDVFREAFGTEWYIEIGRTRRDGEPFATEILGSPSG